MMLKDFGEVAQHKLQQAKVLVIGAGGLGCPAIQYLASMGVGHIGIVDGDKVSISNLHRQILFSIHDIGRQKVEVVREKMMSQYDTIQIEIYNEHINTNNAFDVMSSYDIVLDCTDNFLTRYIINDAAKLLKKPLVFGAVFQYEGQVAVFINDDLSANYRDLFPKAPSTKDAPNCIEAGVYAITTGIIGLMQASEAIKLLTGIGDSLCNRLLTYNARNNSMYTIDIPKQLHEIDHSPQSKEAFEQFDYAQFCGEGISFKHEINAEEFQQLINQEDVQLVDIRNEHELPNVDELNATKIPMTELSQRINLLDRNKQIVLFCHSGIRTQTALELLEDEFQFTHVSHLKGGIIQWIAYKNKLS